MMRRLHNETIKEGGLDHVRFADIRHTYTVLWLQNRMDTKAISQMLDHFRTAMTRQNDALYPASPATKSENKNSEACYEKLR